MGVWCAISFIQLALLHHKESHQQTSNRMLRTRRFLSSNPMKLRKNLISLNQKRAQSISHQMSFENNEALISNPSAFKHLHELALSPRAQIWATTSMVLPLFAMLQTNIIWNFCKRYPAKYSFIHKTIKLGNLSKIPLLNAPSISFKNVNLC